VWAWRQLSVLHHGSKNVCSSSSSSSSSGITDTVLTHAVPCCAMTRVLQAFAKGVGPFLEAVQEHDFLHATKLTLMLAAIAVPLNTVFGTVAAILITRNEFPGKVLDNSLIVFTVFMIFFDCLMGTQRNNQQSPCKCSHQHGYRTCNHSNIVT
jgi:ABC-type sulfate transport system permease subunit